MTPALPAVTDETVTAIALAAARGDSDAAERFVRALQLDVRRFVTYLAQDAQAADDLTQDTFLRALSSLHRFEGRSSARTWLLSIARRVVADSMRRAAVRPRIADTADWQGAAERTQPRGCPASMTASLSWNSSTRCHRTAATRSCSRNSWACPMRRSRFWPVARWAQCARASQGRACFWCSACPMPRRCLTRRPNSSRPDLA